MCFDWSIIERMVEHMVNSGNDLCRSSLYEEESVQRFLWNCPALQRRRLKYLVRPNFYNLECLKEVMLLSLLRFLKSTI